MRSTRWSCLIHQDFRRFFRNTWDRTTVIAPKIVIPKLYDVRWCFFLRSFLRRFQWKIVKNRIKTLVNLPPCVENRNRSERNLHNVTDPTTVHAVMRMRLLCVCVCVCVDIDRWCWSIDDVRLHPESSKEMENTLFNDEESSHVSYISKDKKWSGPRRPLSRFTGR